VTDSIVTFLVQSCLQRLRAGEAAAREQLLNCACNRLRTLAHQLLECSSGPSGNEESADELVQTSLARLRTNLGESMPESPLAFYRVSASHIRRELLDLGRALTNPPSETPPGEATASRVGPRSAERFEIHAQVEKLPEEERAVVDLLVYQELPLGEAAAVLGIEIQTLKRHWLRARLRLHEALGSPVLDQPL
jgi:RNA polymerase sigma factor (sigma-70 family)